jgi:hypothetical protein
MLAAPPWAPLAISGRDTSRLSLRLRLRSRPPR